MTRTTICTLIVALLHRTSTTVVDASVLRGTRPFSEQLISSDIYNKRSVLNGNDIEYGRKRTEEWGQNQHRFLEDDFTVLIPTFGLDQTIDTSQKTATSFAFTSKEKADDVIRSLAENHLAVVYADSFPNIGAPSKVILTVVTNNEDEREDAVGIFVRKSFIGGVATFPGSFAAISEQELGQVTIDAFALPGLGQSFLDALKEDNHPDLEGLLLINSRKIQQDGPVAVNPAPPADSGSTEEGSNPMSSVWAIAAVVALGAMFLTIILCTSILYCDYRKRKQRMEERRSTNRHERRKNKQNGAHKRTPSTNVVDRLDIVVPAASGETENQTPSPSTQGSDDIIMVGNVGRGSIRGSLSNMVKSRRSVATKSKAASFELKDSSSIDKHDYVAQSAPSEVYSVGEDTTMLYPNMNRQRSPSKDNMSEFDGYSMDGMSAMDGGVSTIGNDSKSITNRSNMRDAMYAGDITRDFESIWDDEQSRMTMDGMSVDGATKEAYGDLSKPLNELIENQDAENQSSAASVGLNEFDSGSESGSNKGKFTLELLSQGRKSRRSGEDEEDSILGRMYDDGSDNGKDVPSGGESVDSTPSWAAPIQSAIDSAKRGIFRMSSADDDSSRASSTNDKFKSSLPRSEADENSVKSGSSFGSRRSSASHHARHAGSTALGSINSGDDEMDEHPDAMIDNINSMLSECRVILDKENQA